MTPRAHAVLVAIALSLAGGRVASSADTGREPHIVNGVPTQQRPTTGALLLGDPSILLFGTCSGTPGTPGKCSNIDLACTDSS